MTKKDEEIKEMQNYKTSINYSKIQNNLEKNNSELTNIKKQNEFMKTKIEDVSNLLFIEKEGNKNLKTKLQVFQSSFREFQENSDRKKTLFGGKISPGTGKRARMSNFPHESSTKSEIYR